MIANADALFFSNLAYHGADAVGQWYAGQLDAFGYDKQGWAYLSQSASNPDSYFGVAFENRGTHEIVIADRGSGSALDWGQTDWEIVHHQANILAFSDALVFADAVTAANSGCCAFVTGHSLGGAEAQYQAAELALPGTVFAAPGMAWRSRARPPTSRITPLSATRSAISTGRSAPASRFIPMAPSNITMSWHQSPLTRCLPTPDTPPWLPHSG